MNRLALCIVLVAACGRTYELEDSEGRRFSWKCRNSERCDLQDVITAATASAKPIGSAMLPGATAEFVVPFNADDRYMTVCESWVARVKDGASTGQHSETCRLVTCKTDADCPPEVSTPEPKCLNGLCGDPNRKLTQLDYLQLCLAGTGAWTDSAEQRKRLEIADRASRPTLQPVPKECRQP